MSLLQNGLPNTIFDVILKWLLNVFIGSAPTSLRTHPEQVLRRPCAGQGAALHSMPSASDGCNNAHQQIVIFDLECASAGPLTSNWRVSIVHIGQRLAARATTALSHGRCS